MALSVELMI